MLLPAVWYEESTRQSQAKLQLSLSVNKGQLGLRLGAQIRLGVAEVKCQFGAMVTMTSTLIGPARGWFHQTCSAGLGQLEIHQTGERKYGGLGGAAIAIQPLTKSPRNLLMAIVPP